jgi:hypothetical protein
VAPDPARNVTPVAQGRRRGFVASGMASPVDTARPLHLPATLPKEDHDMDRRFIASIAAAAALALSPGAFAQQAQAPRPSDAELEQFANIYVDLQETMSKFEAQIAGAQTEEDARGVRAKLEEESLATVAGHGWSAQKYNSVAQAISADSELTQKAIELIEDRSAPSDER